MVMMIGDGDGDDGGGGGDDDDDDDGNGDGDIEGDGGGGGGDDDDGGDGDGDDDGGDGDDDEGDDDGHGDGDDGVGDVLVMMLVMAMMASRLLLIRSSCSLFLVSDEPSRSHKVPRPTNTTSQSPSSGYHDPTMDPKDQPKPLTMPSRNATSAPATPSAGQPKILANQSSLPNPDYNAAPASFTANQAAPTGLDTSPDQETTPSIDQVRINSINVTVFYELVYHLSDGKIREVSH